MNAHVPDPTDRPSAYGVLGVLPALVCSAWVAAGVLLLLVRGFHPWSAIPLAAVLLWAMLKAAPATIWGAVRGPRWAVALTLAIVVAAGVWAALHASENLVVRRDPGPYGLVGSWVAQHGTIQMPSGAGTFGHLPGVAFNTPAFYGRPGDVIQPQFMSGLPVTITPAYWLGGLAWLLKANAVIGAFALLAFAGFVARAVGPRAAPFATLVLALAYPETHAFRSPYSEPLTQLMVFGGLCLLWDAGRTRPRAVALAGMVLGLTAAVRVDALADLLPLAAVVVVYALSGRARDARALAFGLFGGVAVGAGDGFLLHYAYLHDTRAQLRLVGLAAVAVAVGVAIAVRVGRWLQERGTWQRARHRLGVAVAVGVPIVAILGWAVRPYVDHPHSPPGDNTAEEVGRLQALAHLRIDPHRTYAEESLRWMGWWVGAPAILMAALAAGLVARRWLQGRDAALVPVVGTGLAVALLVFWRPSITPDHPWADRRFVPIVLPVLVLLATWLIARAGERARWTAPVLALAVLVPTVATTAPLAWTSTENGQLAALDTLCRRIPSGSAVLFVDADLAYRWVPAVRDECGVPTGYVVAGATVDVAAVEQVVRAHGRSLVLLGATAAELAGHDPEHTVGLTYRVDQRTLTTVPDGTDTERTDVWSAVVPG
ncbi:hypothetical protein acdb102_28880 [Acidothermaceae bacterium B102]|nr:hypothetical protein acdb102_28880 [Acidothermaceae bacterium B102]